jgi:hypothetical protein
VHQTFVSLFVHKIYNLSKYFATNLVVFSL